MPQNRQNPNRKDESIRRANRVIQTRTFVLMLIMGIGMFIVLFFKLYSLQIIRHEELQSKAVSQQTRSSVVNADRGRPSPSPTTPIGRAIPPPAAAALRSKNSAIPPAVPLVQTLLPV